MTLPRAQNEWPEQGWQAFLDPAGMGRWRYGLCPSQAGPGHSGGEIGWASPGGVTGVSYIHCLGSSGRSALELLTVPLVRVPTFKA